MSTSSYNLVNPVIRGKFVDTYDASTPLDAADKFWKSFSKHVASHVPRFVFSFREMSGGALSHFEVTESRKGRSKEGTYELKQLDFDVSDGVLNQFHTDVEKWNESKQSGGADKPRRKRYDSSSSSSSASSSSDSPRIKLTSPLVPIVSFNYMPRLYTPAYASIANPRLVAVQTPFYTPVFRPMLGTFITIWP
jgi:hypothetical protein